MTEKKSGGTVTISTREREDAYEITISDDGVGFDVNEPLTDPDAFPTLRLVSCI